MALPVLVFSFALFAFGWKSAEWYIEVRKLRAQNERVQKELLSSNRENFEMKVQLGLPPHRRLILLSEPDPEKTISDAELEKQRGASSEEPAYLGGGGMPLLIIAAAAAALSASQSKKKATAPVRKVSPKKDLSALKARLKDKASK